MYAFQCWRNGASVNGRQQRQNPGRGSVNALDADWIFVTPEEVATEGKIAVAESTTIAENVGQTSEFESYERRFSQGAGSVRHHAGENGLELSKPQPDRPHLRKKCEDYLESQKLAISSVEELVVALDNDADGDDPHVRQLLDRVLVDGNTSRTLLKAVAKLGANWCSRIDSYPPLAFPDQHQSPAAEDKPSPRTRVHGDEDNGEDNTSEACMEGPVVLDEFFDKSGEIYILKDQLSELEDDFTDMYGDQAQNQLDTGHKNVYTTKREALLQKLGIAEQELDKLRRACITQGIDPESVRYRRRSDRNERPIVSEI